MKLFCYGDTVPDRPCCSLDSITDARMVAHTSAFRTSSNFEDRFQRHDVIRTSSPVRAQGHLPIPCVRCEILRQDPRLPLPCRHARMHLTSRPATTGRRAGALATPADRAERINLLPAGDRYDPCRGRRAYSTPWALTLEARTLARRFDLAATTSRRSVGFAFRSDDDSSRPRALSPRMRRAAPGPFVAAAGSSVGHIWSSPLGNRPGDSGGSPSPCTSWTSNRDARRSAGDDLFGHDVSLGR